MQIDFKKETLPVSELNWHQTIPLLVEGDVIVPDIKPDIGEILLTEATPAITYEEASGNQLNFSGNIALRIVYLPEESGSGPKSIETSFAFKESFTLPAETLSNIHIKAVTKHIEFSLINSRKLNVKVILGINGRGFLKKEWELLTDVGEDCPLKIRKKNISTYQVVADTKSDIMITETLELPPTKPEIEEIIKLDVKAVKGDCKITDGRILLKGGLMINTLYCSTDGEEGLQRTEHELLFSEIKEIEGLTENCLCNVNYSVKKVFYSVKEDGDGEDRIIALDVVLQADIIASCTHDITVIDDCYSTVGESLVETRPILLDELLSEGVSQKNIKEILTVPENVPMAGAVYSLQCMPQIQEIKIEQDKLVLCGNLTAFVLYGCVDAEHPMYSLVGEFNFEHIVPVEGVNEQTLCECSVTEQGVSFTLNAASEIELRCVLEFYVRAVAKREITFITGCEIAEESTEAPHRSMVIYFAQQNDTLWDVAKHYKTDQEKIIQLNKLENKNLLPGQKILIPGPGRS